MPAAAPFAVSDEQRALRSAVADLMTRHSSEAQVRTLMATDTGLDPTAWHGLAAMGLTGLLIGAEHGGAGAGPVAMGIAMEEMGRALLVGPFLSTAVLVPSLLAEAGDAAECAAVLPRIATGELIATAAFAEDDSARLPTTIATSASAVGRPWRLTGDKHYVLDGQSAELLYVLAQTDAGPAVFAVDAGASGLDVRLCGCGLGQRAGRRSAACGRDGHRVRQDPLPVRPGDRQLPGGQAHVRRHAAGGRIGCIGRTLRRCIVRRAIAHACRRSGCGPGVLLGRIRVCCRDEHSGPRRHRIHLGPSGAPVSAPGPQRRPVAGQPVVAPGTLPAADRSDG